MREIVENIQFCRKLMQKRSWYFFMSLGHILLNLYIPFAVAAIPQMVFLSVSGNGRYPFLVVGFVIVTLIAQQMELMASLKLDKFRMLFRYYLGSELLERSLQKEISYGESGEGQKELNAARRAIYEGNYVGIEIYVKSVHELILTIAALCVEIFIMVRYSILLALCVLATSIGILLFNQRAYKKINSIQEALGNQFTPLRGLYSTVTDASTRNDIWLYRLRPLFSRKFDLYQKAIYALETQGANVFIRAEGVDLFCTLVRDIVVYGILIYQLYYGKLGLDEFVFVAMIVENCEKWTEALVDYYQEITSNNYLISTLRGFFAEREKKETKPLLKPLQKQIQFQQVSFSYNEKSDPVINHMNLTIRKGEKVAITGLNGAGKSTLIKLLLGIYRPDQGEILWDGQDISQFDLDAYKDYFSVMSQTSDLFPFRLSENISGKETGDEDAALLQEAIRKADLSEAVASLPEKEQTVMTTYIDADGRELSGGQKQKVFMARAIYRTSDIIIFDEPTAAMDPISEEQIYLQLADIIGDRTCIFISHRLSSTRFCDRILFLEQGAVLEEGTHDELLSVEGAYKKLYQMQARRYNEYEN